MHMFEPYLFSLFFSIIMAFISRIIPKPIHRLYRKNTLRFADGINIYI